MSPSPEVTSSPESLNKTILFLPLKAVTPFMRVLMSIWMVLADLVAIFMAGLFSILLRSWLGGNFTNPEAYYSILPLLLLLPFAYSISGLYPGIGISPIEEIRRTTNATSISVFVFAVIAFLTQTGIEFSRLVFVFFWILALIIVPVFRSFARKTGSILGIWGEPVALIGFGPNGRKSLQFLRQNPLYGIRPVVILCGTEPSERDLEEASGLSVISVSKLVADRMLLARSGIRTAIMVPTEIPAALRNIFDDEGQLGLHRLILIANPSWMVSTAVVVHEMGGLLGLEVERNLLNPPMRFFKRIFDLFLIGLGGLVGFPLLLFCAILIRLDTSGPVFYRQERIGRKGKKFQLWKFRTMVPNADEILEKCLSENPVLLQEWETNHKLKNDPRVTKIGRFLRKTSLDELPQLFNIFSGEMSLVGPRPIVEDEVRFYKDSFKLYTQVLPGLTGLWQISGRSNTSYERRVLLDNYYIRHWSIWMDFHILARTVWVVIKRVGAY